MGTALVDAVNKLWLAGVGDRPQRHLHVALGRRLLHVQGQLRLALRTLRRAHEVG
jgi:hypothetical protein